MVTLEFRRTWNYPPVALHFGVSEPAPEPISATVSAVGPVGVAGGILVQKVAATLSAVGPEGYSSGIAAQRNQIGMMARGKYGYLSSITVPARCSTDHIDHLPVITRVGYAVEQPGDQKITAAYSNFLPVSLVSEQSYPPFVTTVSLAERCADRLLPGAQTVKPTGYGVEDALAATGEIAWPYLPHTHHAARESHGTYRIADTIVQNQYGALFDKPIVVIARYRRMTDAQWRYPRGRRPTVPAIPIPVHPTLFFHRVNTSPVVVPLHFGRNLIPPQSRRILIMNPTCTIVRLPDRFPIETKSVSITEQIDSYTHEFSVQTNWAGVQALFEGAEEPTPLEITVNGHIWVVVAESYTESVSFGRHAYTVTGFGQSILLDSPHSELRSYTEENVRTAQQLAAQELPQDWELGWYIVDWEVPAGVWSYTEKSPIQAISSLAQSAGAFLQTHLTEKIVLVRPRYEISAWAMDDAEPDAILSGEVQFGVKVEQPPKPGYQAYNGVFLSGTTQGVAGLIRIPETQGEKQRIVSSDPLILTTTVLRERGREELSASYPRPTIQAQVPLMPPPGSPSLIRPGDIVEVRTEYAIYRDVVRSATVTVNVQNNGLVVRQTLDIGDAVANPWVAMESLNPGAPLLSCAVLDHNADGTSTVELPGGSQIRVRGQSVEIGEMAFVKDGQIIGEAPDLPTYTLDAFDVAP